MADSSKPVSVTKKEKTHSEILRSATRLLRTRGIDGASVALVMKGAGLTVGGFYAHFDSKEALISEAFSRAMTQMRARLERTLEGNDASKRLEQSLEQYLSAGHRDQPEEGCPLPATLQDLAETEQAPLQRTLAEELELHVSALRGSQPRDVALGALALMVGGLSLARALRGSALSDEVLRASVSFGKRALGAATSASTAQRRSPASSPKRSKRGSARKRDC